MICFSTVQISLSSSDELALSASSPSFSRQAKRASGGTALGSYPQRSLLHIFGCTQSAFSGFGLNLLFLYCRHPDGDAHIFPPYASLLSGGLGAAPPKSQPILAVMGTSVAHKVPACYIVRRTPQGIRKSGCQIPRFQRISALHDAANRFPASWRIAPKWHWLCFKYRDLSHISAFWLSRTFQGHPAHSFRFRLVVPRSTPVVPAQRQEVPQQTTPPAVPPV